MGGDLILYQRDLAIAAATSKKHREPTWYMKVKIGDKFINKTTKLRKYEDAYAFARDEYLRLSNAIRLNHSLEDYTFEKHWNDWFQRNVNRKTWKSEREKWHEGYFNRYFKKYFSYSDGKSMLLNDITAQFAHGYFDWRVSYWSSEQGQKIEKYNAKRRNAKTQSTHNVAKAPSSKTLAMEQSALNQIFHDAREQGRLQQVFKLKSPKKENASISRRPHFDLRTEYTKLIRNLRSYRDLQGTFKNDRVNEWHKLQRHQLYHFVIFLANSGLRVGEAREMRWEDIKFDHLDPNTERFICIVSVRKATKTRQNRDVHTQPSANKTLKEWFEKTKFKAKTDYVWLGNASENDQNSQPFTDLNKSFQTFLGRIHIDGREKGLLFNKEGEKRTLYSLRHTYATFRSDVVPRAMLAANMGTSEKQIAYHYDHNTTNEYSSQIVQPLKSRKKKQETKSELLDPFLVLANQKYLSGEIDEATFLGIMNSKKPAIISRS